MNYLKLFENFREQPLEKEDIQNLLEGTGIIPRIIFESPIRNREEKEFYLGWVVRTENYEDWVYQSPRNYKVDIEFNTINFIWNVKPHSDILLSKLSKEWLKIKNKLDYIFKDIKKSKSKKGFRYHKEGIFIFEIDLKEDAFIVSKKSTWDLIDKENNLSYFQVKDFIWIYLESIIDYKSSKIEVVNK
jgi:hypothetical protein